MLSTAGSSSRSDRDRGDRERSDRDRGDRGDRGDRDRDHHHRSSRKSRSSRRRSPRRRSKDRGGGGGGGGGGERRRRSRSGSVKREKIIPLHLRQRKLNHWDMPPPGYEGLTAEQVKATGHFPLPGQSAKAHHILASITGGAVLAPDFSFGMAAAVPDAGGALPSSIARQARRLYVGNIPYGITEETLIRFFNDKMIALNIGSANNLPVIDAQINHEKNYAFVEFRTAEESSQAMSLDGVPYQGQILKIRRPKDYQAPPGHAPGAGMAVMGAGMVSTTVPDSPHKLFVGGLPSYLNDEQVMELLRSFGDLRAFNLVKDSATGLSKGYAFAEYANPAITDIAAQGLNGMELGDKKLIVQRASIGATKPAITAYAPAAVLPTTFLNLNAANMEPTNILMLLNMVTPEELTDDNEYQDIMDDIKDECSKYGPIDSIYIPRPNGGDESENPHVGKVFLKFVAVEGATTALKALAGRQFASRTVFTSYVDEEVFERVKRNEST
ncbi:hypothetical protein HDU96_002031 [Phlyctochytrium bullatum]|nr:hypothetical protein HDU96_002031 [Phlyctochytrium bullatum]